MKKVLILIAGLVVSSLLILALIGYVSGPVKPYPKHQAQKVTPVDNGLDNLNATLDRSNLTLCEVYHWVEDMEAETRKDIEAKRPDMAVLDRMTRLEQIRAKKWKAYCDEHSLNDTLKTYVGVFGFEQCK